MNKNGFDLTICIPIWYGAKLAEVENCLDSIYTSAENFSKTNNNFKISCLIGIDNMPKDLVKNINFKNNIDELIKRINILKEALKNIDQNQFDVNYFITEFNVKVSVMRNIMISKTQNSRYITFVDHDDLISQDAISIIFESINKNKDKNVLYFLSKNAEYEKIKFEFLCAWSVLYDPKFLLKHNISFIPGIPFEDRFFRRELELYLTDGDQANVKKIIYIHNKEQGSGFLSKDMMPIVRQELNKRKYYTKVKPKIYSIAERGLDKVLYIDIVSSLNKINITQDQKIEYLIANDFNNDNFLSKEDLKDRILIDNREIAKYSVKNHFELCTILFNGTKKQVFCKGYLTNDSIDFVDDNSITKINKIIESLNLDSIKLIPLLKYLNNNDLENVDENILSKLTKIRENNIELFVKENNILELEKILNTDDEIDINLFKKMSLNNNIQNIIEKYIFNQAFIAIQKEDVEKLSILIENFPNILKMQREDGVNLQNVAAQKQIIETFTESGKFLVKLKQDREKIISKLLLEPEYFLVKDKYGKSGADFLLFEYIYFLKTNCNCDKSFVLDFLKSLQKILIKLKDKSYKIIPCLRFLYEDFLLNKNFFAELLNKEDEEIITKLKTIKCEYFFKKLIPENIIFNLKNSNYDNLRNILIEQSESIDSKIGIKEEVDKKDMGVYHFYTSIDNILGYKILNNQTVLDYIKNDHIFKDIIQECLINSLSVFNKKVKEPLCIINVERNIKILDILKDPKNDFDLKLLKYNDILGIFLNYSKILIFAQVIRTESKKVENSLSKFNKKIKNSITNKQVNVDLIDELFNGIDNISLNKNKNDIEKIILLFNLFKNYLQKIDKK